MTFLAGSCQYLWASSLVYPNLLGTKMICCCCISAADIILWRRGRVTFGVIFGATMAWLLFEKSGLSFLTICCDILLILIVVQFIRVKIAELLNR
jgi:hypothetical protein